EGATGPRFFKPSGPCPADGGPCECGARPENQDRARGGPVAGCPAGRATGSPRQTSSALCRPLRRARASPQHRRVRHDFREDGRVRRNEEGVGLRRWIPRIAESGRGDVALVTSTENSACPWAFRRSLVTLARKILIIEARGRIRGLSSTAVGA